MVRGNVEDFGDSRDGQGGPELGGFEEDDLLSRGGGGLLGDPSDPDTCSDVVEQGFTVFLAGGDQWSLVDAFRKTTEAYSRAKR